MKHINVLPLNTWVKFGGDSYNQYTGKIITIQIRKNDILYEVCYWINDSLKTIWLTEDYFEVINDVKKCKIGFEINEKT